MSPQHIEIVALQWAAIHEPPVPEVTMTSPYLDHVRSTRKIIEDLIVAREVELAKTTAVAQWQRVERELSFLHETPGKAAVGALPPAEDDESSR